MKYDISQVTIMVLIAIMVILLLMRVSSSYTAGTPANDPSIKLQVQTNADGSFKDIDPTASMWTSTTYQLDSTKPSFSQANINCWAKPNCWGIRHTFDPDGDQKTWYLLAAPTTTVTAPTSAISPRMYNNAYYAFPAAIIAQKSQQDPNPPITSCPAGQGIMDGVCKTCRGGSYSDGAACQWCPDGTVSEDGATSCTPCPAGYTTVFAPTNNNFMYKKCVPVPSGSYIDYPAGGYSIGYSPCPQNSISNSTKTACVACSPGTYADLTNGNCTTSTITGLSVSRSGTYSGQVSWNAVPGATTYICTWGSADIKFGQYGAINQTTNSNTFTISGLYYSGYTYSYSITPVFNGLNGTTTSGTFTVPPLPVSGVTFTSITPTSVNLNWSGGDGASQFSVTAGTISQSLTGSGSTFAGLSPGQTYTFTITPYNYSGTQAQYASSTTAGPITTPPTSVSGINFTNITSTSVTINWTPGQAATSYTIAASDGSSKTTSAAGFTYSGLNPGTAYTFTITPMIGSISGPSVTSSSVTTVLPPLAVTGLSFTNIGVSSVTVGWSGGGKGATSFLITGTNGMSYSSKGSGYTITGLSQKTSYTFTVTPYNGTLAGDPTSASVTTTACPGGTYFNASSPTTVSITTPQINGMYTGSAGSIVLQPGMYTFNVISGSGGYIGGQPGYGRYISFKYQVSSTITLSYVIGGQGLTHNDTSRYSAWNSCGGGGGATYLYDSTNSRFICVAGGGGGGGGMTNVGQTKPGGNAKSTTSPGTGGGGGWGGVGDSSGGGGINGNGVSALDLYGPGYNPGNGYGGLSYFNGSTGGANSSGASGGFGGGAGCDTYDGNTFGGAGGGYTGGSGGPGSNGGTSYLIPAATLITDVPASSYGDGSLWIGLASSVTTGSCTS